jgi:proline iminopeptidase
MHLIDDIELPREHLGINRWVVVGGSWGVALGLVYAQRHPERVIAMVLAAGTAGTWRETDWITRDMGRDSPREWEQFAGAVPAAERGGDLSAAYARLLADLDPQVRAQAARQWCAWEDTHMSLAPGWVPNLSYRDPEFQLTFARLVTHYWSQGCFLKEGEILAKHAPPGGHPRRARPRPLRRFRSPGHRMAPAPRLAKQQAGRS